MAGGLAGLIAAGGLLAGTIPGADASPVASAAVAHASGSAQSPTGTVTAIDSAKDTFTMKTTSGATVDVTVSSTTIYKEGTGSGKFSDLKVGGGVGVIGTGSSSAVTASIVIIGKASSSSGSGAPGGGFGGGFGGGTFGTVSSVDSSGDSFVVKELSGTTITVKVSKTTTYVDRAKSSANFSDVTKGIRVAVTGTTSSGTEDAKTVLILGSGSGGGFGPGGGAGGGFAPGTAGTVSSVDSSKDTFVLKETSGTTITVKVTKSTTYRDATKSSANFSDVTKGATVAVTGTTSSGTETATTVTIGGFGGAGGGFGGFGRGGTFGTVSSVDSSKDTFVLKEASGTSITVKVTKSTTYTDSAKKTAAGFSDVTKGATVAVTGSVSSGVETATSIRIGTFRRPGGAAPTT
jgi:hypothetical protein